MALKSALSDNVSSPLVHCEDQEDYAEGYESGGVLVESDCKA